MRIIAGTALLIGFLAAPASARQQADPSKGPIRAALDTIAESPALITPEPIAKMWGGTALVQPDVARGEFVRINVPVGEMTMKAARAIQKARHQRAQRKARERVDRALQEFLKQPSSAR